ncbi:MAG: AAA family ATPase [Eubacteriales bacterium]|nr:AAA family ATPase [Eubacteriales bacterium]
MINFIPNIKNIIPSSGVFTIEWDALEALPVGRFFADMKKTPQNPAYHGEGDVYAHTVMVCEELIKNAAFCTCSERERIILFLAALLHDIGKIRTTRMEEGGWTSPHHSAAGSLMAREFLWKECGLCGTEENMQLREAVCALIRYHMLPIHLPDQEDPGQRARKAASVGELAKGFSWKLLCILAEADIKGRIAPDMEESLGKIELCRMFAEDAGCFDGPYPFLDDYTKRACLAGRNVLPDQRLYDDTWGEVILMAGLPGTGKDTWIQNHAPFVPIISLDEIRKELRIKPTDPQGSVIELARERAKMYLRKKRPFIWNATNITPDIRQKQISLFERYGAGVRIVYLETEWNEQMKRNESRTEEVPQAAIERMLAKLAPPVPEEAKTVEWHFV